MTMGSETYLAFCLATALLILMPGPIVTLTVANSLKHGSKTGFLTTVGATVGSGVLLTAGAFGMAWALDLLADWFTWLRIIGAGYLIYLGFRQWREAAHGLEDMKADKHPGREVMLHGFVVAITNPKTILFYAAFFPQFIDLSQPTGPQLFLMSITFLCIAVAIDGSYAFLAGRLRPWLQGGNRGRIRNRITGTLLVGTGIALAFARKP
jgi:homoserine/homoserine lactone efflux protein